MEQQGETGTITMQTFGGLPGPTAWTPEGATVLFDPRFLFSPEELLDTYYDAMTYDDDEECLGLPHEHLFLLCRCRSRRAASSARPAGEEEEEEDRVGYGLDSTAVAAVDYEDNLEALGFFDFVRTLREAFEALGEGEENYDADVEEAYCEVQAGRSKRRTSKRRRRARRWEKKKKNSIPATGGISSS